MNFSEKNDGKHELTTKTQENFRIFFRESLQNAPVALIGWSTSSSLACCCRVSCSNTCFCTCRALVLKSKQTKHKIVKCSTEARNDSSKSTIAPMRYCSNGAFCSLLKQRTMRSTVEQASLNRFAKLVSDFNFVAHWNKKWNYLHWKLRNWWFATSDF